MKITIGSKVQSIGGVEGEVISFSSDRHSVVIKVPGNWLGTGIVSIPLIRVKHILAYTPVPPALGAPR